MEKGAFLGSSVLVVLGINDPVVLETLACSGRSQTVVISSDRKKVVEDIKLAKGRQHKAIIQAIRLRSLKFRACDFMHESRKGNLDAHNLVKFSLNLPRGRHLWFVKPHDSRCIPMNILFDQ